MADRYSLEWVDLYMDEILDKMGSDLFPLPIKLNRFITTTLDFIRETTDMLEASQEISDDIKPLLVRTKFTITKDVIANQNLWTLPEPENYIRLISLVPLFIDVDNFEKQKAKKVDILKEGQREVYKRDPYREPTAEYPQVFRFANLFKIDLGNDTTTYSKALISYIKQPTFAKIGELENRIVNLPDISIEKIIKKTADSLRFTTADVSASMNYQFDETFGKRNK